jgi:hypothetical protein
MPQLLYPWERPVTHFTGGRVGPRASLDVCKNLAPTGIHPACSQSLYRLNYPAHQLIILLRRYVSNDLGHLRAVSIIKIKNIQLQSACYIIKMYHITCKTRSQLSNTRNTTICFYFLWQRGLEDDPGQSKYIA